MILTAWFKSGTRDSEAFAKDTPLDDVRFVVLDTELTSLNGKTNRLLSVGGIALTGTKIHLGDQFYRVVNPGVAVPAESVVIHKLRPEDVANGESPAAVFRELQEFIAGSILMGHFAEIDRNVLRKEFASCGLELTNPMVCTARVQRWIIQKSGYKEDQFRDLENVDLETLAKSYGLDHSDAHHALADAFMTAHLWQRQKHALEKLGAPNLGQLLKIARV